MPQEAIWFPMAPREVVLISVGEYQGPSLFKAAAIAGTIAGTLLSRIFLALPEKNVVNYGKKGTSRLHKVSDEICRCWRRMKHVWAQKVAEALRTVFVERQKGAINLFANC